MTTRPTVTTPTLRNYQEEAVSKLIDPARAGKRLLGLVMPTGAGKTVTVAALIRSGRDLFRGALIGAPTMTTESGFMRQMGDEGLCVREASARALDCRVYLSAPDRLAWVTTHPQLTTWKETCLPDELAGRLLVLDEAHHAGSTKDDETLNTEIGNFREAWISRGGTVLMVTATPFRSDRGKRRLDVFPKGTWVHTLPMAVYAASGRWAPGTFQFETVRLSMQATTAEELEGASLPAAERAAGSTHHEMIELWERHGRPKSVFIVPPKNSKHWAAHLERAFPAGVRVLNVVGESEEIKARLDQAMLFERDVKRFEDSRFDVILAAKRFDEGTDWPLCSHVYNLGIPGSMGLILQRFGRAMRKKVKGHPHADVASMTFMVPGVTSEVLDAFDAKHQRLITDIACLQVDWKYGLSAVGSKLAASWSRKERRGQSPGEARDDEAGDAEGVESGPVHDHLIREAKAILTEWITAHEARTGSKSTFAELTRYARDMAKTRPDLARALRQAALEMVALEPDASDIIVAGLDSGLDCEALFEAMSAALADKTIRYADEVFGVRSRMTGEEIARVKERLSAEKPDLTEEMIVEAARRYYARTGMWPNRESGDATEEFGFLENWRSIDNASRLGLRGMIGGSSLLGLLIGSGLVGARPKVDESIIVAAALRHHERFGRFPTQKSGDATDDFGFSANWQAIDANLRTGSRGLTGGSSLADLLQRHGLKKNRLDLESLSEDHIVEAAIAFKAKTGAMPNEDSGDASEFFWFPITWNAVASALRIGGRSLLGGSSLSRLLQDSGLANYGKYNRFSVIMVISSILRYHGDCGRIPKYNDGNAGKWFPFGTTWRQIDTACRLGLRGLPKLGTLRDFTNQHFDADNNLLPGVAERYGLTRERLLSLTKDDFNPDGTLKDAAGQVPSAETAPETAPTPAEPAKPTRTRKPRTPRQPKTTATPVQAPEVERAPQSVESTPSPALTVAEVAPREPRRSVGKLGRWFWREGMGLTGK